jgi:hypothetical protein
MGTTMKGKSGAGSFNQSGCARIFLSRSSRSSFLFLSVQHFWVLRSSSSIFISAALRFAQSLSQPMQHACVPFPQACASKLDPEK